MVVFYRCTFEDVYEACEDENMFVLYALDKYRWKALNIDRLYGSSIFDDDLYLCVVDGAEEIEIDGEVYPAEYLFEEGYTPDDIAELIEPSTPDVIREYIDEYVLSDNVDYAELVISMLKNGEELNEVVDSYDYIRSEMHL